MTGNNIIKIFKLTFTLLIVGTYLLPLHAQTSRPNILFLLADDMRPDCISALGNPRIETPNLDRMVLNGTAFNRASCSYPICTVSRTELLTGRHAWSERKANENEGKIPTWPEQLKNSGYETWHVGKWHVKGRPSSRGYTKVSGLFSAGGSQYWKEGQRNWRGSLITGYRGWIFQSDDGKSKYPEAGVGLTPDINIRFADSAIALIRDPSSDPWFCQVNFTAPHDPLMMPPGLEGKYRSEDMVLPKNYLPRHPFDHGNLEGRDEQLLDWPRTESAIKDLLRVYYSVIEGLDAQIGRILTVLKETGQLENTIIIFSSDHGLACGSHGLRGKQNQYEHTINVPLIMMGPHIKAGWTSDAQVYLRELYPTTCDLANVDIPEGLDGKSFKAILQGSGKSHHKNIYGYFTDTQRMIRTEDGWKLIRYPKVDRWQLFDLNTDPFEIDDLVNSSNPIHKQKFNELRTELNAWRKNQGDPLIENNIY